MDSFTIASFGHLLMRVCLLGGLTAFVMAAGEWAIDYNIKKAVKTFAAAANIYVETQGEKGSVWPLLIFSLGVPAIFAYLMG